MRGRLRLIIGFLALVAGCSPDTAGPTTGQNPIAASGSGAVGLITGFGGSTSSTGVAGSWSSTGGAAGSLARGVVNTPPPAGMTALPVAGVAAPVAGNRALPVAGTGPAVPVAGSSAMPMMPVMLGPNMPVIPAVAADCPKFIDSTITYMGLGGIQIVAGAKPAGPTAPMVFYWHGTGSFAGEFAAMATAVQQGVVSEGGVLVSFQDTTGGDLLSGTAIFGAGDFKITDQLLACAVRDQNIDPRRVFATGCSAGGLFSAAMAAERSTYIAAAAPNSGGWTVPVAFQNKYTPALMTVHGAAGVDVVVIDFSSASATADQAFKAAGGFVINCDHGGGHCGGAGLAPDIWKFFKAHPYGVDPKPWAGGLPAGFSTQCKIY
jgi:hypothetical protein